MIINEDHDLMVRSIGKFKRSKFIIGDLDQLRSFCEIKIMIFYSSAYNVKFVKLMFLVKLSPVEVSYYRKFCILLPSILYK